MASQKGSPGPPVRASQSPRTGCWGGGPAEEPPTLWSVTPTLGLSSGFWVPIKWVVTLIFMGKPIQKWVVRDQAELSHRNSGEGCLLPWAPVLKTPYPASFCSGNPENATPRADT